MRVPFFKWAHHRNHPHLHSRIQVLLAGGLLFIFLPGSAFGLIADRIMAVVDSSVIALSDVREYGALFPWDAGGEEKAALNQLIEQKILLAEAKKLEIPPPTEEEVVLAYQDLENRHGGPEAFMALRERMTLSEAEIHHYLKARLHIEKLIKQRIRFFVFATPREVEAFREKFPDRYSDLPEEEALAAIQESIIEKKTEEKLATYIARLKTRTDIQINDPR